MAFPFALSPLLIQKDRNLGLIDIADFRTDGMVIPVSRYSKVNCWFTIGFNTCCCIDYILFGEVPYGYRDCIGRINIPSGANKSGAEGRPVGFAHLYPHACVICRPVLQLLTLKVCKITYVVAVD